MIAATALAPLPEVRAGDDLPSLLLDAADRFRDGDVLVVAHKVVSKAEGQVRRLADVRPGERARALGAEHDKDPRMVQVVLDESAEVVRAQRGVLICRTHHGFVCANAGVDASNAPADETVVLLPRHPDGSARALRAALRARAGAAIAVVIADSFGRAWRHGQSDIAIGCAGLRPLDDWRGRADARGRELKATWIAVADEAAAAADLARSKDSRQPAVLVRGLAAYVADDDGPGAIALVRALDEDLFR
ncbi:MAG TPA: coenzyme F420-0:L-glutamate ligase [Solirubrobacteraceae bacterium]|nr:coenzyme F420-0:L-glutamate ligase [Solirubrobacteraceae bacterium]